MAHYIAMRCGEPDAFPMQEGLLREPAGKEHIENSCEEWRPWRAYAAMHLWAANSIH